MSLSWACDTGFANVCSILFESSWIPYASSCLIALILEAGASFLINVVSTSVSEFKVCSRQFVSQAHARTTCVGVLYHLVKLFETVGNFILVNSLIALVLGSGFSSCVNKVMSPSNLELRKCSRQRIRHWYVRLTCAGVYTVVHHLLNPFGFFLNRCLNQQSDCFWLREC